MKRYLLLMCISCGGPPFTMAESVIMTDDASSESTSIGSEADSGQSELHVQPDGAVLLMGVDSGDASTWDVEVDHYVDTSLRDSGVHDEDSSETSASVMVDASPDSSTPLCCNWGPVFGCVARRACDGTCGAVGSSCMLSNTCYAGNPTTQGTVGMCQ